MLALRACIVVFGASRFGQNYVTSHHSPPMAVKPAPENTHSLFCTIHSHIVKLALSGPIAIQARFCGTQWIFALSSTDAAVSRNAARLSTSLARRKASTHFCPEEVITTFTR